MMKLIMSLILVGFASISFAKSKEIIDLSLNLQKANNKAKTLRIKLPLGELASMESVQDGQKNKITVKAIKWKKDLYKLQVKVDNQDELVTNSELVIKQNQEAIIQDFDAEGNNAYKIIIKAKR